VLLFCLAFFPTPDPQPLRRLCIHSLDPMVRADLCLRQPDIFPVFRHLDAQFLLVGVMHGKCRRTNERLDGLGVMKIEDLRYTRTEQGRLCGSCWRSLCIICRSRLFASVWPLQFLQKQGVGESLTGNQAL
jgi:hypothetical protein